MQGEGDGAHHRRVPEEQVANQPQRTRRLGSLGRMTLWPNEEHGMAALLLLMLLIYSTANYAANALFYPALHVGTDFPALYTAAEVVLRGENPYDMSVFHRTSTELGLGNSKPYVYHPLFAYLFLPLTLFPPETANALFAGLNLVLLLAAIWFATPRGGSQWPALLMAAWALAANFSPIHNTARLGRVDLGVALLLILALCWLKDGRPGLSGVMVGLATMLKTSPGLLLVYFLWRRQWRAFIAGVVTCGIITALGFVSSGVETNVVFWRDILLGSAVPGVVQPDQADAAIFGSFEGSETMVEFLSRLPGHPQNLSLAGIGYHLFNSPYTRDLPANPALARALALGTAAAMLASLLWLLRPRAGDNPSGEKLELEYGLVVVALVLVPTVAWEHHMVLLILPLWILSRQFLAGFEGETPARAWLILALCYAGLAVNYGYWVAEFRSGFWVLLMSLKTYFSLALYGLLAWQLSRRRAQPG